MNGRKAKELRRKAYGKGGEKNEREYSSSVKVFKKRDPKKPGKEVVDRTSTTIFNKPGSLRAYYQALKRDLRRS